MSPTLKQERAVRLPCGFSLKQLIKATMHEDNSTLDKFYKSASHEELQSFVDEIDLVIRLLKGRGCDNKKVKKLPNTRQNEKCRTINVRMRYDILRRDEFKCVLCGRSPKEDGVKLHVDHVVPWSKGGLTTESNLRSTCQDCNLGKANKDE